MKKILIQGVFLLGLIFTQTSILWSAGGENYPGIKKQMSLVEAIGMISIDYNVFFTFDHSLVEDIKVEYNSSNNQTVEDAITGVLNGTDLQFKLYDQKFVILYQNDEKGLESLKEMVKHFEHIIADGPNKDNTHLKLSPLSTIPLRQGWVTNTRRIKKIAVNITGVITGQDGEPLIGVNVQVKGTNKGTATDFDGNYILNDVDENAILVFSYIGYQTQELSLDGRNTIDVTMLSDAELLDEVVVVAFGSQKKISLTGAVSALSGDDLAEVPAANFTNALIGQTPGVNGLQVSGEPGRNGTDIKIRGISTYGNTNPLIVIDGIEQPAEQGFFGLDFIDPHEVESISVLKDASATAVYGIRGANGVLVITTKRGKSGKPNISLSSDLGFTQASMNLTGVNSHDWAFLRNESIWNEMNSFAGSDGLQPRLFSDDDLWKFKNNRDFTPEEVESMEHLDPSQKERLNASPALYYQNNDPYDQIFGNTGAQRRLNLNVSGGTDKVKYFTSFGYFNQDGFNESIKYFDADTKSGFRRYNFRSNFDIDVIENLQITLNISGQFGKMQGQGAGRDPYDVSLRYEDMMHLIVEGNPIQSLWFIDDKLVSGFAGVPGTSQNPLNRTISDNKGGLSALYFYLQNGTQFINNSLLDNTARFEYKMPFISEGLKILGSVNYQDNYSQSISISSSYPQYRVQRSLEDPNVLEFFGGSMHQNTFSHSNYDNWSKFYADLGINYEMTYAENHNFSLLGLGKASKYNMPNDRSNTPSGIIGFAGRVRYNFADKYFAEVNMGYNGTEQFATGKRFGFFPAYSGAWVTSNESFFPDNNIVTLLKFRGSYGEVGNDLLGVSGRRYLYLPNTYSSTNPYYLGRSDGSSPNTQYSSVVESSIGNPNVTWEVAKKMDFGIETLLFRDKLTVNFDWFLERRNNILTVLGTIPTIYGVAENAVPPANIGITRNRGYEVLLRWEDNISRNFRYYVEGHVTYTKNKVIYKSEPPNPFDWMNETGKSIGQPFGLYSAGLYNTKEELMNRPYNTFTGNRATLGDIRYLDLNGDGLIDNLDVGPIGYPSFPQYSFGLKLNVFYKGFGLSSLVNGSRNGSYYLPSGVAQPFSLNGGMAYQYQLEERWTPEKAAAGAEILYPRVTFSPSGNDHNFLTSDFWQQSTDFIRLKNVQLSYSFDLKALNQIGLSSLSVYVSGNNLFTFATRLTGLGIDPEQSNPTASKYIFPLVRVYNAGFSVKF